MDREALQLAGAVRYKCHGQAAQFIYVVPTEQSIYIIPTEQSIYIIPSE